MGCFLAVTADGLRCTSRRSALGLGSALLMPRQRALADMQGTPFGPCERNPPRLTLATRQFTDACPRDPVLHRR